MPSTAAATVEVEQEVLLIDTSSTEGVIGIDDWYSISTPNRFLIQGWSSNALSDDLCARPMESLEAVTDRPKEDGLLSRRILREWRNLNVRIDHSYARRIEELRSLAEVDGVTVNQNSVRDFWSFVRSTPSTAKAGLVLMDNGNLRAVWRGQDESRVGMQFLGRGFVEFVIFKRRPNATDVSRGAGIDTLDGFTRQIQAFDLGSMLPA